jgi:NAD(P)-dependent dehydrogenase (short-subunit alcohol dehydrogenase family)
MTDQAHGSEQPAPTVPRRRVLQVTGAAVAGTAAGLVLPGSVSPSSAASPAPVAGTATTTRRFDGAVVAITGGTSGIGEATARAFAAEGARVTFCGRRANLGQAVERSIRGAGGDATYIRADVREPDSVRSFVDRTVRRHGRLDIAFNNAGIQINRPLQETTVDQWDDSMNTNARGAFLAMRYEIDQMLTQGSGVIVVNSSIGAMVGRPGLSLYQATKRALLALVASAALEYGSRGIRVNAIAPGIVDTAMIRPPGFDDATWASILQGLGAANVDGLGRVATPAEIASAVLALCSDDLAYMTGTTVPVDGGITAGRPIVVPDQTPADPPS